MKRGVELGTLLVAVLAGYGIAIIVASPAGVDPSPTPGLGPRTETAATTTLVPDTTSTTTTTTIVPRQTTYLVWSTGGLTPDLVDALEEEFDDLSVVRGDVAELDAGDGWVVPLDALALDPEAHRPFDPTGSIEMLRPGTVVLGESSAEYRSAAVGDTLTFAGNQFEVVGVAPDEVVGAAEVVFTKSDENSPAVTDRYALVSTDLPRAEFEESVRSTYDGPAPLRIRTEGETPWLRHGDAVLPQIFIKMALGEFSYTNRTGSGFFQDAVFREDRIVDAEVALLGTVTCHEAVAEMLDGAMTELVEEGLAHLVDPAGFAGCWNPRYINPLTGSSAGVSRHAWGAAVDVNAASNPYGSAGTQDPRLVEIMLDWGFTWGGDWLVPDPMHFEYGIDPG